MPLAGATGLGSRKSASWVTVTRVGSSTTARQTGQLPTQSPLHVTTGTAPSPATNGPPASSVTAVPDGTEAEHGSDVAHAVRTAGALMTLAIPWVTESVWLPVAGLVWRKLAVTPVEYAPAD